ncbi:hypothetical protein [Roseivirga echinicomitans]|uniref:Helix-turn-helix type 11 domain-containing protein n=1 Tax=Roseivirga echinicomitans TaxID=296218 RepID=A0A150XY16_9BACT|nr:hypothetical protein [Roseivirga echinicomitans]KYG83566.1 hypothetical protein AWN68_01820 [Roseivirga echinicomitans]
MEKQIERIERLHNLIRLKATGTPKECAEKLEISERQLYRLLDLMKELGAPVYYEVYYRAYCYEYEVEWSFGFKKLIKTY